MSGKSILGGKNSLLNNPGQLWGGGNSVINHPAQLFSWLSPTPPQPQAPPAPPSPGAATQSAVQGQIQNEAAMRGASALYTGGTGLLDQPTVRTASQMLMGS